MRIISEKPIREFWVKHIEAEKPMREWMDSVREANWKIFTDIKQTFNHADVYKCCVIFDVGGNKYRIIAKVAYGIKVVFIRFVLTHEEYDFKYGKKWKPDCED